MEFEGVGKLYTKAPPADSRPFFERKHRTWFKALDTKKEGFITREGVLAEFPARAAQIVKAHGDNSRYTPAEVEKKQIDIMTFWCLCEKDKITEKEFVDLSVSRVFGPEHSRISLMERWSEDCNLGFWLVDNNQDNQISLDEFRGWYGSWGLGNGDADAVFRAIDADASKEISMNEWKYAFLDWGWCNTDTKDPISLYFDPLVD